MVERSSGLATQKAVILARGLGTRMRRQVEEGNPGGLTVEAQALAGKGAKALIPLCGRPFLDYVLGGLLAAGLRRVCLVIAPDGDELRDYAREATGRSGAEVGWAVQREPRGTADAVLAAEQFAAGEAFLMVNCDNLYPPRALAELTAREGEECWTVAFDADALGRDGNIAPERVRAFAVVVAAPDGRLVEIVEKPAQPERYKRNGRLWVGMNLYRFTPAIFEACRRIEPHPERGELELTSAVSLLARDQSVPLRVLFSDEPVLDLTSRADIPAVEALLEGRGPGF